MPLFDFLQRTNINPFLFFSFLLLCILPTLWAIWHIVRHSFKSPWERTAWLLFVMLFPVVGGIVYFFWGKKRVCGFYH